MRRNPKFMVLLLPVVADTSSAPSSFASALGLLAAAVFELELADGGCCEDDGFATAVNAKICAVPLSEVHAK